MNYLERTDDFIASLGLEAYRVGGSVRDEILGRRSKDADYMIRADLREIQRGLLANAPAGHSAVKPLKLRDGRQAGWRITAPGMGCIEIVMPRTEVSTGPGHRDFEIVTDPSITVEQDAIRRDFTFNALYKVVYHPHGMGGLTTLSDGRLIENVLDPTGKGLYDLTHRQINVTHADSFRDDPLRTLRALRFISTLGYELGRDSRALMALHSKHVNGLTSNGYVSGTVPDEFSKLLMGDNPAEALRVARDTGVLAHVMPELQPMLGFDQGSRYHDLTTDEHVFKSLETAAHVDAPLRVRWALLFHDSGKPETAWVGKDGRKHYYASADSGTEDHEVAGERIWREAASFLSVPSSLRDDVALLIRHHMVPCNNMRRSKIAKDRIKFGDDLLRDLYMHRMCDLTGKGKANRAHLEVMAMKESVRAQMETENHPCKTADLAINGHDVMDLGVRGRQVGEVLKQILHEVATSNPNAVKSTREWQLNRAEALI